MTTTEYRFEFGVEGEEQIDNFPTLYDALRRATQESNRRPETKFYVYDRMAHIGANETYTITGGLIVEIKRRTR
jgi:hypothetical protein